MTAKHFTRDLLPSKSSGWPKFQKKEEIRMVRIDGPFVVETKTDTVYCPDGWLALDDLGYPFPVSLKEHQLHYQEAKHASNSIQQM